MKKIRIAVFENDEADQFIYRKTLGQFADRAETFVFDNPQDGFKAAENMQFDIVFINMHFLGITFSSVQILRRLKEIMPVEPMAIAMTPIIQNGDREIMYEAGFHACMEKPFTFEHVGELVDACRN